MTIKMMTYQTIYLKNEKQPRTGESQGLFPVAPHLSGVNSLYSKGSGISIQKIKKEYNSVKNIKERKALTRTPCQFHGLFVCVSAWRFL